MVSVFHSHLMYHLATADDFQICSVKSKDRVFEMLIMMNEGGNIFVLD